MKEVIKKLIKDASELKSILCNRTYSEISQGSIDGKVSLGV